MICYLYGMMKVEAAWSSEMFVSYITTWQQNPEDNNLNYH